MNTTKLIYLLILLALIAAVVYIVIGRTAEPTEFELTGVCTEEAKICDDGTTVVRSGPNCEYERCPR